MSHYANHQGAINTGAINHVSFPGAEEGLSLVELTGTVEVTCALSAITLRLTASASTSPAAVGSSPNTTARALLAAITVPTALASAAARTKIAAPAQALVASADTTVIGRLRFSLSAPSTATAAASVGSYVRAAKSASATASATASAGGRTVVPRSASTACAATTAASALRYRRTAASTSATSTLLASTTAIIRPGATTSAVASVQATARSSVRRGASTSAVADAAPVVAGVKLLTYPQPAVASALAGAIAAQQLCVTGATGVATSSGSASIAYKFRLGATVQGSMISTAAAADYGITQSAPTERLMIVPASDRRMEVTL